MLRDERADVPVLPLLGTPPVKGAIDLGRDVGGLVSPRLNEAPWRLIGCPCEKRGVVAAQASHHREKVSPGQDVHRVDLEQPQPIDQSLQRGHASERQRGLPLSLRSILSQALRSGDDPASLSETHRFARSTTRKGRRRVDGSIAVGKELAHGSQDASHHRHRAVRQTWERPAAR